MSQDFSRTVKAPRRFGIEKCTLFPYKILILKYQSYIKNCRIELDQICRILKL